MSEKIFTAQEIKQLSTNPYVKTVSAKAITYTDKFKQLFISEYEKGKFPRDIFEECGFDVESIGMGRVHSFARRWKKAFKEKGTMGLTDTRKGSSGRPRLKELSIEEKVLRLEAQNKLLQAENELLKKIDLLERGLKGKK